MPVSARSQTAILAAGVIGGIALAIASSFALTGNQYGTWAPLSFVLPLAAALMWLGRLRLAGALCLVAIVAVAFVAAMFAAMFALSAAHGSICMFCNAQEQAANMPRVQLAGAAGGLVGGLLPFAALTVLGADLRDRTALLVMAATAPLLALFGSIGLSGALPGATTPLYRPDGEHFLILQRLGSLGPWQLVFGSALAFLLSRHTPKPRAKPAAA